MGASITIRAGSVFAALALAYGCGGGAPIRGARDSGVHPPDTGPPPPTDAGVDPSKDPATLVKAAVVVHSCLDMGESTAQLLSRVYSGATSPSDLAALVRARASCLATTGGGCDAIGPCLGIEPLSTGTCVPGCQGNTLMVCGGQPFRWNCDTVGLTCSAAAMSCVWQQATCSGSACVDDHPVTCLDGGVDESGVPIGIPQAGPDCAQYGLACTMSGGGEPFCEAPGGACDGGMATGGAWSISGCVDANTAMACVNGAELDLSCSDIAAGMTCQASSCSLGGTCDPSSSVVEYCRGNEVGVCNAGRLDFVDCVALGFSSCMVGGCH